MDKSRSITRKKYLRLHFAPNDIQKFSITPSLTARQLLDHYHMGDECNVYLIGEKIPIIGSIMGYMAEDDDVIDCWIGSPAK